MVETTRYPLPGHVRIRLNSRSGAVDVVCEARSDLEVEDAVGRRISVELVEQQVTVSGRGSSRLAIRCPAGTDLVIGSLSGSIEVRGRAGSVVVSSASGGISLDEALSADLRTMSGRIAIRSVTGQLRAKSASGSASADHAGRADIATVSGSVNLVDVKGEIRVHSVSGDVEVAGAGRDPVTVKTMSGGVTIRLPKEARPNPRFRHMSGHPRCDLVTGTDCEVAVSTMSGRVEVVAR